MNAQRTCLDELALSALRTLLAPLAGSGRGLFGIAALLLLLIVGGYVGWAKWGSVNRAAAPISAHGRLL